MNARVSKAHGDLFVIAAPSGAGKTSLVKEVLQRDPRLRVSISHTTRTMRPTEQHGRDYHFVTVPEFEALVARNEFLEHARVFDNYYGTGRSQVAALRAAGHDVILEIDWQGAQQVRKAQADCRSVFILPPSRAELEQRLRTRRTDSAEVIARRLRDAVSDMRHYHEFDYVIVNDDFDLAANQLLAVLGGQGDELRANRAELQPLLAELLG
jgi:guanylate kinase